MNDGQQHDQSRSHYAPVAKNAGATTAEKYLGRLCEKAFLSLWSYPGVYRDQGDGKEICDLLVVFGDYVLIFSDKDCVLCPTGDRAVAWRRWFSRAIAKSAEQAWGAKRWIEQQPGRVFLDKKCTRRFPFDFPKAEKAKFHLIVVAHGISQHIVNCYEGSGSFLIDTGKRGFDQHTEPYHIGDLDPEKPFVHVFDEQSLNVLMETRDTISDFIEYLNCRELFLRRPLIICVPGEEELLAIYLTHVDEKGDHYFPFNVSPSTTFAAIEEGFWEDFQNDARRKAQLKHDKISYMWDDLIERFNHYALLGQQHFVTSGGLKDAEKALRFMAAEPRYKRRAFANCLRDMLKRTPEGARMLYVAEPVRERDPYYIFVLFPAQRFTTDVDEYRKIRLRFLEFCCLVVRLLNPLAKDIVGIATESGIETEKRSEDVCYFDGRHWNAEMEQQAREAQATLGILINPIKKKNTIKEYPNDTFDGGKIGRNEPCPCGSGRKYKKCCL